jgi:hypothetical protein
MAANWDELAAGQLEKGEMKKMWGQPQQRRHHDASWRLRASAIMLSLATVCAVGVCCWTSAWAPGASEMIDPALERASRSWDQAHKDMAEYEQRWHLSRYTEEDDPTEWEDGTPVPFNVPPINNEPTRNDLGYWSRTKQPTPVWVDLPKDLSKPGPGEPQANGIPDSGTSDIRWGAPVVRKMPEAFLEQIHRMKGLLRKVKAADKMSNLLLDKEVGEIAQIKTNERMHADTQLEKDNDDLNFLNPKIKGLKPPAGPRGPPGFVHVHVCSVSRSVVKWRWKYT